MTQLRLVLVLVRPAVIWLLVMFTATGLAEAGRPQDAFLLGRALVIVVAFLLCSVAWNDLADEAIDRVNLPGQRPLTTGAASRGEFVVLSVVSAVIALAVSATLGWPVLAVTVAGLAISAGYSLRPVRLADRGAVASLALPACYVATPYLIGLLAARRGLSAADIALAGGLYLGFIGRILLKDFRDVRGDALFGKRTFLVRHGRVPTCVFSAICWAAGTCVILLASHQRTPLLIATESACLAGALAILRALATDRGPRRDEALISASAILGRGMILLLLAHLSMTAVHWPELGYTTVLALLFLATAGQAAGMAWHGPASRLTVPAALSEAGPDPVLDRSAAESIGAPLA